MTTINKIIPIKGNLPPELVKLNQWVVSDIEKAPLNPNTGQYADVTTSTTWASYEVAVAALTAYDHAVYVGFVFTEADDYVGIDLDNPSKEGRSPKAGEFQKDVLAGFHDAYIERSVSGTGFHIIARGSLPDTVKSIKHKETGIEIYEKERYFTVTSATEVTTPKLPDRTAEIHALANMLKADDEISDSEIANVQSFEVTREDQDILNRMSKHRSWNTLHGRRWNGENITGDGSSEDYALLKFINFYTQNLEQCMRLFMLSARGPMLSRKTNREAKYLEYTARKALVSRNYERAHKANLDALADFKAAQLFEQQKANAEVKKQPDFYFDPSLHKPRTQPDIDIMIHFPPGAMGQVAKYVYDQAAAPCIAFASITAIMAVAGIAARAWHLGNTDTLNIFACIVGGSTTGKSSHTTAIDRLYRSADESMLKVADDFIGPNKLESANGFLSTMAEKPCHISRIGEFGKLVTNILGVNTRQKDPALEGVILEAFNTRQFSASGHKSKDNRTKAIEFPAASLLGDTTASSLFGQMTEDDILSGLLSRFLFIDIGDMVPIDRPYTEIINKVEVPDNVKQLFAALLHYGHQRHSGHLTQAMPISCPPDSESFALLSDYHDLMSKHKQLEPDNRRPLYGRRAQIMQRIAAMLAIADSPNEQCVMQPDHIYYAKALVEASFEGLLKRVNRGELGDPDEQRRRLVQERIGRFLCEFPLTDGKTYKEPKKLHDQQLFKTQLMRKLYNKKPFKDDYRSPSKATADYLKDEIETGRIILVSDTATFTALGISSQTKVYKVLNRAFYEDVYQASDKET